MASPCPCRGCLAAYKQGLSEGEQRALDAAWDHGMEVGTHSALDAAREAVAAWFKDNPVYIEGNHGYHEPEEILAAIDALRGEKP